MPDDAQLLRRYATERSEEAFAELVRRHLGLVYTTALRQCGGDAHRAEDVAQAVFADLAHKAARLAERPVLAGWLYTSTRYASAHAVRTEARRQAREQEAYAMSEFTPEAEPAADWERLRPVIDDVLDELNETDREAVLLRFFEDRAFGEIGVRLALSEDAARMRVDRALERMRGPLARRGLTSTSAALGAALAGHAVAAVPAGLAASITGAVLGGGTAAAVITFMSMTKLQVGAAIAVLAAGAASLVYQHNVNARLQAGLAGLQAVEADNARLRDENRRLTQTGAELAGLRAEHAELVRLRGELAAQARVSESAPAPVGIPLAAGLLPVEKLGNAGRATPRATFATQLWAARTGDLETEAAALAFEPETRAKLVALAAQLPAELREQYDTPEKLMAFILSGSRHPVGGMQVLGETVNGPDSVTLQTEWQHADDAIVHHSDVQMQRGPDGWKLVVPAVLVDRAAAYLTRSAGAGQTPGGN